MSRHSSSSLEGGCHSSADVIEDTENCIQFEGLYSLFTAFEKFTYLRDFLLSFGLFDFLFKFERFLNQYFRYFLNRGLNIFKEIYCALQHVHFATHTLCNKCTLHYVYFAKHAFATRALCNTCTLQHVYFAHIS